MTELTPAQKAAKTRAANKAKKELETTPNTIVMKADVVEEKPLKSFSLKKEKEGWYFVTSHITGDKVVKEDLVGPTMRAIVIDELKVEVQRFIEGLA